MNSPESDIDVSDIDVFAWCEDNDLKIIGEESEAFLKKLKNPDPEIMKLRIKFLQTLDSDLP